jgi:hypothetical protein
VVDARACAYQFRQTYLAPHFGDESHSSPNRKDEGGAADTNWRDVGPAFGPNTLETNNASSREVHFCKEFLEAWIGVNGVESGVLSDSIQATSVPISLVQPLKCPILVPELRINGGDFIGTYVRTTGGVPSR